MENPRAMGTLVVVVGKARHLPNKSRFGKQDPFCSVRLGEEKQRTKAVKRGGQHPEWDEELRFTLYEDVEDTLSASASSASLPPVPPKDGSNGILPGTTTAAELAAKSRKKGKGNKAMRIACYADDAKEPGLIGDCVVDLTEVLKTGEVEEWYAFHNKERYSGEVYLELTFFSNGRPPVRRNVPRPQVQNYGGAGTYQSSSSLSASGSVSGMSLYIPPYATPAGSIGPSGSMAGGLESLAAEVGSGAGRFGGRRESYPPPMHHHSHSLNAFPQPIPAPSHLVPSSTSHELDALNRPFSSLSLGLSHAARPTASPAPSSAPVPAPHPHHAHRHSLTGPPGSEAPWARFQPPGTPAPIPEHHRPSSTNPAPWDQYNAATTAAPQRPVSQASYLPPSTSYGHHQALPASLLPAAPPQNYPPPTTYQSPALQHQPYAQTPPPHPSSAPPAGAGQRPPSPLPPSSSHYQVPLSSFHGVQAQPLPPAPPPERHWSEPYPSQPQPSADYSYRNGSGSSAYAATPPPPPPQQPYQTGPPQSHVPWHQQTQHLAQPPPVPHRVSTPSVYPSLYEQSPTGQHNGSWQQPQRSPSPQPPVQYGAQPPRGPSPAPPGQFPPQPAYGSLPNASYDTGYHQQPPAQAYYPPTPQASYQAPPERVYTPQPPPPNPNQGWQSQAPPPAPASNTGKAAWKAYMNGAAAPPASAPPTNEWYTPPPALPASIAPPEGWQSTLPQHQQRQW